MIMNELTKMDFDFELTVSEISYLSGNLNKPHIYYSKLLHIINNL